MKFKFNIKIIGNILTILSFIFILYSFLKIDLEWKDLIDLGLMRVIAFTSILLIPSMLINSVMWKMMVTALDGKVRINLKETYVIYSKSNISKYIPGNVMHYASRNLFGKAHDIDQKSMFFSSVAEVILKIVTVMLISFLLVRNEIFAFIRENSENKISTLIVAIFMIILGAITFFVLKKKYKFNIRPLLKCIIPGTLLYAVIFIIHVCIFFIFLKYFNNANWSLQEYLYTGAIYILSWFIGYITPGAPGGLGVKESVMIFFLGTVIGRDTILLIAVFTRLSNILTDLYNYIIASIIAKK